MSSKTLVPVEVYLRSTYEPDAEYVDGVIEERPAAEYDHSSWHGAILAWFGQHAGDWNVRVRPSLRMQAAPMRYRVPDVTIIDRSMPVEQILTHPPIAVFEVLSPEDTVMRFLRKLSDYEAMGIAHIWVIDPETRVHWRYRRGSLIISTQFGEPGDKIHFDLSEIEKLLD